MAGIKDSDKISNKKLKEIFLNDSRTAYNISQTSGIRESSIRRFLGLTTTSHGGYQTHVSYDMAVRLCEALELDPVEIGL